MVIEHQQGQSLCIFLCILYTPPIQIACLSMTWHFLSETPWNYHIWHIWICTTIPMVLLACSPTNHLIMWQCCLPDAKVCHRCSSTIGTRISRQICAIVCRQLLEIFPLHRCLVTFTNLLTLKDITILQKNIPHNNLFLRNKMLSNPHRNSGYHVGGPINCYAQVMPLLWHDDGIHRVTYFVIRSS